MTKLKVGDILTSTPDGEYRVGKKATLVGWLKELYLFGDCKGDNFQITDANRKRYVKACDILRGHAGLSKRTRSNIADADLHDYEEKITNKKVVSLLNKTIKDME